MCWGHCSKEQRSAIKTSFVYSRSQPVSVLTWQPHDTNINHCFGGGWQKEAGVRGMCKFWCVYICVCTVYISDTLIYIFLMKTAQYIRKSPKLKANLMQIEDSSIFTEFTLTLWLIVIGRMTCDSKMHLYKWNILRVSLKLSSSKLQSHDAEFF